MSEHDDTPATTRVLLTSGEYSDYRVEDLLDVPSVEWLRERIAEYRRLKTMLDDWTFEHGSTTAGDGQLHELLPAELVQVADHEEFRRSGGWVEPLDFEAWLYANYPEASRVEHEVVSMD